MQGPRPSTALTPPRPAPAYRHIHLPRVYSVLIPLVSIITPMPPGERIIRSSKQ